MGKGSNLKAIRKEHQLTQVQLSKISGVSLKCILKCEYANDNDDIFNILSMQDLVRLAITFELDVMSLYMKLSA